MNKDWVQYGKILILGGTDFMGKALLDVLDKQDNPPLICCINRGKDHWYTILK
jgi:hypothetical protein